MADYYSNWKTDTFSCRHCNWVGVGDECVQGDVFNTLVEMDCPKCREKIFLLTFPTDKETEKNWEKVSKADKQIFLIRKQRDKEFSESCLNSPSQLPDLEGDDIVLTWDIEDRQKGGNILIKHGEQIIWKELAWFEGYGRFMDVAKILKEKYQNQLQDLVPTRKSKLWLCGDSLVSLDLIKSCRSELAEYEEEINKPFKVLVYENWNYTEKEYYQEGEYESYEAALAACKNIVDEYLTKEYKEGMSVEDLYQNYMTSGVDPAVVPKPKVNAFSGWDYAKERCSEIYKEKSKSQPETINSSSPPIKENEYIKALRIGAKAGHAKSLFSLGVIYADGTEGVTQDLKQAVYWYQKAAEKDDVGAQSNLGKMYAKGDGVIRDDVQALKWWNIASANGDEIAKSNRDIVIKGMTSEQIDNATSLAIEWVETRESIKGQGKIIRPKLNLSYEVCLTKHIHNQSNENASTCIGYFKSQEEAIAVAKWYTLRDVEEIDNASDWMDVGKYGQVYENSGKLVWNFTQMLEDNSSSDTTFYEILNNDVKEYITKECNKITNLVKRDLQKIKDTLSADDSGLINAWDEICVQMQGDMSVPWDMYDLTVKQCIKYRMRNLSVEVKRLIWHEVAGDYQEENDYYDLDDIVNYIADTFVYPHANNYSNLRIDNYLDESEPSQEDEFPDGTRFFRQDCTHFIYLPNGRVYFDASDVLDNKSPEWIRSNTTLSELTFEGREYFKSDI